ncbi:MAG: 4Fe-4S binding protein [Bacteroidales bacterium]|nr:4Fe-4S binding protein [Bacteroidales bacterium]
MHLLTINPEKCTNCHNCVRVCPVHAIRIQVGMEHPEIIDERCIGCGSCLSACTFGAITYQSSTEQVIGLLQSADKVAAIVDPSISGEFPDITDYRKFVEMIRSLGFEYVNEVSFGVDLVALAYKRLFSEKKGKYYITANCPAIVYYIEKFVPSLIGNLAPIISPMMATANAVKHLFGDDVRIVYIGPCIAAKREIERTGEHARLDAVLTFEELRKLFADQDIHESQLEYSDFDPPIGRLGSLYPISSGILEAANIDQTIIDGDVITSEGSSPSLKAIGTFENHIDKIRKNFNIFYNEGCVMGPGMTTGDDKHRRNALVVDYSKKRLKDFDQKKWEAFVEMFSKMDMKRSYNADDQRLPVPDEAKIREILQLIGKDETNASQCGNCGFESCKAFAVAVGQGLTRTDICYDFAISSKNKYIGTLRESNKKYHDELQALKEELKKLRDEYSLVNDKLETSREIMNQIPSGVVIVDEKLKVTSSNRSFIELLGDEIREIDEIIPGLRGADLKTLVPVQFYKLFQNTLSTGENIISRDVQIEDALLNVSVFSIKKNKVVGGIVRDMFSPEVRNEQIIHRITEVIDQNLEMVQQIGFLLGEGASKTEAMLNSIIQLHRTKKKR